MPESRRTFDHIEFLERVNENLQAWIRELNGGGPNPGVPTAGDPIDRYLDEEIRQAERFRDDVARLLGPKPPGRSAKPDRRRHLRLVGDERKAA